MRALLLALSIFCANCATTPPPAPPPPVGVTCLDACRHMQDLGCPAAWPTNKGATCADVCENVQSSGIVIWDLVCMTRAPSCPATTDCQHPVQ